MQQLMVWYDWLILILPVCFVMYMGFQARKYVRGVSDFLSAGRICGRYVISAGAWSALLSSMGFSGLYIYTTRNWADVIYPAIAKAGLVDSFDRALQTLSAPFAPYIKWTMDPVRCPVNKRTSPGRKPRRGFCEPDGG